jgi:Domain of unknown function (DUF4203)
MNSVADNANDLASTVSSFVDAHQDGIVGLVLLLSVVVTFTGRLMVKPTVFTLGLVPAFLFCASLGYSVFCNSDDAKSCASGTAVPIVLVILSLILGVVAGMVMLRLLFALAIFAMTAASGAVLVAIVHVLMLQPESSGVEVVMFSIAIAAALVAGSLSLVYPEVMTIAGTSIDGAATAIFSLAHFLGDEPEVPGSVGKSSLWSVVYAVATVLLGTYGMLIQLRTSAAGVRSAPREQRPRGEVDETEPLLSSYGSVVGDDYSKNALGAPPLASYEDEEAGHP